MKDPPAGYQEPAVDVLGNFNEVLANISSSAYTSEHDFQAHLLDVFNSVHDGHFRFVPDLLAKAITFRRPIGLVSVSLDGVSEPKVYGYSKFLDNTTHELASIHGKSILLIYYRRRRCVIEL